MDNDQTLSPRDAARLRRIADASTGGSWEKILHSPRSCGISPATIDLLEQVTEADGTIRTGSANSFECEVGGTHLRVRGGRQPAFESSTPDYPTDLPHLRALADHPVKGHGRRVQRHGEQMTVTVRVPHGSGSELATIIAAAQETDYALKQAVAQRGAGYDLMAARFQRAGLAVPQVPKALKDLIEAKGDWWWATNDGPKPHEDYLLESVEVLQRPVADHVAISHAGHGLNSYGLNWRQAYGPVAFLVQTGWGGGLSDNARAIGRQAELFARTSQLVKILEEQGTEPGATRIRRLNITASDFRGVLQCQRWNGALAQWEPVPLDDDAPWEDLEELVEAAEEVRCVAQCSWSAVTPGTSIS